MKVQREMYDRIHKPLLINDVLKTQCVLDKFAAGNVHFSHLSLLLQPQKREHLNRLSSNNINFSAPQLPSVVQFSSVRTLDRFGRQEDVKDDSADILFQPFLQEALLSSCGIFRDVHSFTLSIQHSLCRPRRCPPSKEP